MLLSVFFEYNTEIDNIFAINRIQTRLTSLVDVSDIIENANINIPDLERIIHAKGSISNLSIEQYEDFITLSTGSVSLMVHQGTSISTIVSSYQALDKNNSLPVSTIAVEFSAKQLQSQINPHFLYNSYFVLSDMVVNEDYENLADFTRHMGTYFQYITRNSSMTSLLEEEVQHARIYASFQVHRFRNRISMDLKSSPRTCMD